MLAPYVCADHGHVEHTDLFLVAVPAKNFCLFVRVVQQSLVKANISLSVLASLAFNASFVVSRAQCHKVFWLGEFESLAVHHTGSVCLL